jgi:hypothetical protein
MLRYTPPRAWRPRIRRTRGLTATRHPNPAALCTAAGAGQAPVFPPPLPPSLFEGAPRRTFLLVGRHTGKTASVGGEAHWGHVFQRRQHNGYLLHREVDGGRSLSTTLGTTPYWPSSSQGGKQRRWWLSSMLSISDGMLSMLS